MTPREHFTKIGRLTKSKNKPKFFSLWKFQIGLQWGEGCWSTLSDKGHLSTHFFAIGYTESTSGEAWARLLFWRLNAVFFYRKETNENI